MRAAGRVFGTSTVFYTLYSYTPGLRNDETKQWIFYFELSLQILLQADEYVTLLY